MCLVWQRPVCVLQPSQRLEGRTDGWKDGSQIADEPGRLSPDDNELWFAAGEKTLIKPTHLEYRTGCYTVYWYVL